VHQRSTFDDVIQALSKTFILQDQSNASVYLGVQVTKIQNLKLLQKFSLA
jgi:hypothetical protein